MRMSKDNSYDAIVIGSGMGGLATASILAQVGKRRVLVLERHFKLGGFTHSFRRKQFEWDVGLHYVGEMYPKSLARRVMNLVTGNGVEWQRMGSTVERLIYPGFTFEIPDDPVRFKQALVQAFPAEKQALHRYFRDVAAAQGWMIRWFISKQYPKLVARLLTSFSKLANSCTADYFSRFSDPKLRAILAAQWPDYGTPPAESAFGFHATVTADYFRGGYYPIGGAHTIATQAERVIEQFGGKCAVNHEVTEILCEHNRAVGVRVKHKQDEKCYYAPIVVSDAGATTTFGKLVTKDQCSLERQQVKQLERGTSAIVLFLGLNDDPRKHGFDDANYWLYEDIDYAKAPTPKSDTIIPIDGVFLSFGSLRDPQATAHTAQIIGFTGMEAWADFEGSQWMQRGDKYEQMKNSVSGSLVRFVNQRLPALAGLIEYQELATPLTIKSFTGHESGMIYGQKCNRDRLNRNQWTCRTTLKNLYLTGSDVGTPGINGAMMAAVMTSGAILGWTGLPRVFAAAYRN